MLGKKSFQHKLYYGLSLQNLVSRDDFYCKLEKAVDLSWVRAKVAERYSDIGRPSIDPEVFVKIELIAYLENITSERKLMRDIQDRLSLRRYIGYDLDEQVPDHSTLSKTRDLLGKELLQDILDQSVRLCTAAGMVGGVHLSGDRSLVKANASLDSMEPRIIHQSPQKFIERVFTENSTQPDELIEPNPVVSLTERADYPTQLPVQEDVLSDSDPVTSEPEVLAQPELEPPVVSSEQETGQTAAKGKGKARLSNATSVSRTDPDATIVARPDMSPILAYSAEFWTDSRHGIITHADAFTGIVPEYTTAMAAVRRQRGELGLPVSSVSYDKGGGQGRLYRQLKEEGIVAFIPHREYVNSTSGPGLYRLEDFMYDAERGVYVCPAERELKYTFLQVRWPWIKHIWRAKTSDCKKCQMRSKCTKSRSGRELQVNIYQSYYDEMDERLARPGARLAAIARKTGPEPRFAEGKQWQGLGRAKYRGLEKFRGQVLLTAAAQNFKKYVNWIWRKGEGAGRATLETLNEVSAAPRLDRALSVYGLFSC